MKMVLKPWGDAGAIWRRPDLGPRRTRRWSGGNHRRRRGDVISLMHQERRASPRIVPRASRPPRAGAGSDGRCVELCKSFALRVARSSIHDG